MTTRDGSKNGGDVSVKHHASQPYIFKHRAPTVQIQDLLDLMVSLRAPDGCPWDRAQTFESLLPYLREESAEYIDAVREGDTQAMKEELGDVLLQIVFHSQIAREQKSFDLQDVIDGLVDKLYTRHPHVFGERTEAENVEEVEDVWASQKRKEREARGEKEEKNPLRRVPRSLPTLVRTHELSKAAASVGFDFDNVAQVLSKVEEELGELREAMTSGDLVHTEEEIGDVLMSVSNLARKLGVEPEAALARTNRKFVRRFDYVVDAMTADGLEISKEHFEIMQKFWDDAREKRVENTARNRDDE